MLRIIQQTSSAAARSYYSTADYFTEGQELQGVWRGKSAELLGLSGTIQQPQWDALCENLHPATGEQLTARRKQERRVGWDFSFSVPKSVSLFYALTRDERILDAFTASVDETMADIESELHTRVRRNNKNTDRLTGNAVWGRFVHFTSRPVDGIPDPQLHAHNFLFNSTFDGEEGRWKAAQIVAIKRDANYFNALMQSRLAVRLVELGLPVERTAKGWRIAGFSEATDRKFSRRTQQIDAKAAALGITDPHAKAELGAHTREGKVRQTSMDELRDTWRSWLTSDENDTVLRLHRKMGKTNSKPFSPEAARDGIQFAAGHHFERESVVPERLLLTTALNQAIGAATPTMVQGALNGAGLIFGQEQGRRMVTSPVVLDEERRMIEFARHGRNAAQALAPDAQAPAWFNPGQVQALAHLCGSTDTVMMLRGVAGAGKTTLLSELKHQVEAHGRQIHAFAPSSEASRTVLRASGFDQAETVAMLLKNPKLQEQLRDQVVLIDEAGQLGTPAMAKVFDLARQMNARVILSGDRYQHGSVERGAVLRLLEEEAGIRGAALTQIVRQKDQYRQAVAYLSHRRFEAGFRTLEDLKWIHEIDDPATRYERIAAEYIQAAEAGKSVLVVSPTHSESQRVTHAIRSALQDEGKIGPDKATLTRLVSRNLTLAERGESVNYEPGDVIQFTQNAKGFRKGTRLVAGTDPVPLALAARFAVYRPAELKVAEGDLIRVTANGTTADGHRVNNGQVYTVDRIAQDGTLTLNNGWRFGPTYGHLDHAYCGTSHSSQGKTKDRVIIAESNESFPAASREQFYVSVSRGRNHCSIYTDDKAGLLEAIGDTSDRLSATELAGHARVLEQIRRQSIEQAFERNTRLEPERERAVHHR